MLVNLDDETISLYESLNEYGYNFFDSKDKFYNDICSKYTTKSGTDIILSDRQQLLKNQNNVFLCQDDCTFLYYNSKTKHSYCSCSPQKNDIQLEIEYLFSHKGEMIKSFYTTLSNSNFKVMKCYELLFSKNGQLINIGSYILIGNLIFIFILIIF